MRRVIAAVLALAALAVPAAARAQEPAQVSDHVTVGISEQSPDLFEDQRFHTTGLTNARLLVPYDVVKRGGFWLHVTDVWLERARRDGIEPLVSFSHSFVKRRQFRLPSVAGYAARVAEFRARYPWVRTFSTWNEANHKGTQPTGRHPRRAAVFYRALKKQCVGCTVVAVEILLNHSWKTWRWIRRFRERAGRGPHIFGIHNYPDVTRLRNLNTRLFLRRVPRSEVWLTETGGVVRFKHWRYNEARAGRAVRHVFKLAAAFPRVKRVYLYNWRADGNKRWDSGLISRDGILRRGFFELLDALALDRFRPLRPVLDELLPGPAQPPLSPPPTSPPPSSPSGGPDD